MEPVLRRKPEEPALILSFEPPADEDVGRAVRELLARPGTLILHKGEGEGDYSVSARTEAGSVHATGETLPGALQAATGRQVLIRCKQCDRCGPVEQFPRSKDYRHGRKPVCRTCERKRNAKYPYSRRRRPAA